MFVCKNVIEFEINGAKFSLSDFRLQILNGTYPKHSHSSNSYEVHFFPEGNGKMIIEDEEYEIVPNTLIVTGPKINHEQIPNGPLHKYSLYLTLLNDSKDDLINIFLNQKYFVGIDKTNILNLFNQIKSELQNKKTGYIEIVESLTKSLIILIIRNYNNSITKNKISIKNDLTFEIEAIFLNEFKTITVTEMSKKLFLSTRKLQRILQKQYGKTFNDLKLEARMNYALTLITNSSIKINEIALNCGYSTTEHFTQAFKKCFNQTPLKYRKMNKK